MTTQANQVTSHWRSARPRCTSNADGHRLPSISPHIRATGPAPQQPLTNLLLEHASYVNFFALVNVALGLHALIGDRSTAVGCRHRGAYRIRLVCLRTGRVASQPNRH